MLKIFITDLQAYNEGSLVGEWIELPLTAFELSQALSEVLSEGEFVTKTDNHEEVFITDYEWDENEFFSTVDEYEDIYKLNKKLQAIAEVETEKHKAIAFLLTEGLATDIEDAIDKADDVIVHENQSMKDLAYFLLEDCYGVDSLPSIISNHIDYDGVARSLEYEGTYFEIGRDIFEYVG